MRASPPAFGAGSLQRITVMPTRRIASALVLICALSALPAAAGDLVPFKGTWSGKTVAVDLSGFPIVVVEAAGTGNATHLGHFTMVSPHSNNVFTFEVEGNQIFTAANGDTLTAHFTGVFTPHPDGSLSSTIPCTITGGTGRFAGATGQYDFQIVAVPLPDGSGFASTAVIDGLMSSVGSNKK
jgi:hypothetical protein